MESRFIEAVTVLSRGTRFLLGCLVYMLVLIPWFLFFSWNVDVAIYVITGRRFLTYLEGYVDREINPMLGSNYGE